MKCRFFSMKNNSKKMRCRLLQILNLNEAAAVTVEFEFE